MLKLLKKKENYMVKQFFIGDRVNLIYRFKGVFFIVTGLCIFNKPNSFCILSEKRPYYFFFNILNLNIYSVTNLNSFSFDKKVLKIKYKNYDVR